MLLSPVNTGLDGLDGSGAAAGAAGVAAVLGVAALAAAVGAELLAALGALVASAGLAVGAGGHRGRVLVGGLAWSGCLESEETSDGRGMALPTLLLRLR